MSSGTVGNPDIWRVSFVDDDGQPAVPDGPVRWTAVTEYGREVGAAEQPVSSAVATGVYEWAFVPGEHGAYSVKVATTVAGVPAATPAMRRAVVR